MPCGRTAAPTRLPQFLVWAARGAVAVGRDRALLLNRRRARSGRVMRLVIRRGALPEGPEVRSPHKVGILLTVYMVAWVSPGGGMEARRRVMRGGIQVVMVAAAAILLTAAAGMAATAAAVAEAGAWMVMRTVGAAWGRSAAMGTVRAVSDVAAMCR